MTEEIINIDKEIIKAFHQMWDTFPGMARLIRRDFMIIAANPIARESGFSEGVKCINVGVRELHKGCRSALMMKSKIGQLDRPEAGKVRGWLPVEGFDDIYVHFTLFVPEINK